MALGLAIVLLLVICIAVLGYFVARNIVALLINSILGLIILFLVNGFHVMSLLGKPDIPVNWVTVMICALGGVPGALILIVLHLIGYDVPMV